MENDLENKIIYLYLNGIGSTTIMKMLNISKKNILYILNKNNLIRNRKISDEFYSNFWEENGKWYGYWVCNVCNEKILFSVNQKSLIKRNLNRKNNVKNAL